MERDEFDEIFQNPSHLVQSTKPSKRHSQSSPQSPSQSSSPISALPPPAVPSTKIKGRGVSSNPSNRFYTQSVEPFDDGWWLEESQTNVATEFIEDRGRTIISTNQSPDIPFDQSINPYRGCEHGCVYCYARPTHAYWDMSAGLDFETKIIVKPNADVLLRKTLSKPTYQCKVINIGANTDPYQPAEKKYQTTKSIIEVLKQHRHPFSLITKSALILRDLELLAEMASMNLCSIAVSVTTLNNDLKRKLEPRTANGEARLRVIEQLSEYGIPVTMMVAPVIPFINDHEIESIVARGASAGARSANMIFLRLPLEVSPMFQEWLELHYPDKAKHVMSLVRSARNGSDYESKYHTRMMGEGDFANMLRQRFKMAAKKSGLRPIFDMTKDRFGLDTTQFTRGYDQMSLF